MENGARMGDNGVRNALGNGQRTRVIGKGSMNIAMAGNIIEK